MTFKCVRRFAAFFILISLCPVVMLTSCSNPGLIIDEPLLSGYHALAIPTTKPQAVEEIDCYIDYSFGMGEGMQATDKINKKLNDFLVGRKVTYYRVGATDEPKQIDLATPQANFLDLANYKDPGSKLKVAVDKIVASPNRSSVFITDFERVDNVLDRQTMTGAPAPHPIDASAWAQKEFKAWITAGNQLDIFATPYEKPDFWFDKSHKKKYANHIYMLVFTPRAVIADQALYKSSVLKFLADVADSGPEGTQHFTYNHGYFEIVQDKKDETIGNANDNLVVQELITTTKDRGFEFYSFSSEDLVNLNTDEQQADKRIINKIRVDMHSPCLGKVAYGIKTYDVTSSLTDYSNSLNQEAPEVNVDVETGAKDTVGNVPVHYAYRQGAAADNLFDFVYNPETHEAGIKMKPDFTGVSEPTVYRIDLIVQSAELSDFSKAENTLRLNYANYSITSLGESVKYAMNDAANAIDNKILYTLYIQILP